MNVRMYLCMYVVFFFLTMSYLSGRLFALRTFLFFLFEEAEPTCGVEYHKLGCFKDNKEDPRLLNKLILTDRDSKSPVYSNIKIDWGNWNAYLPKLACRCAEKAAENKFTHFGLQFYGEEV